MFIGGEKHGVCLHNAMLFSPTERFSCSASNNCSAIAYPFFLFQHFTGGFFLSFLRTNRRGVIIRLAHQLVITSAYWEKWVGNEKEMTS